MLRQFSKMGYTVAGFGRRKDKISELKKELNVTDDLLLTPLDITDYDAVSKWCKAIQDKYGAPYILINNVGSTVGCAKDTWLLDMAELQKSLNIHICGTVNMIKAFVPKMIESNSGMILNMSSWAGQTGYSTGTPYCASKFAIEGITQCLAKELEDAKELGDNQVLACCISPGFVNTDMLKGSYDEQIAKQKGVGNGDNWAQQTCEWILSLNTVKDDNGKNVYHGKSIGPPIEKTSIKKWVEAYSMFMKMEYNDYVHEPNKE